jgi:hypothetical protein
MSKHTKITRLAVLIDGENVSGKWAPQLFCQMAELGVPTIRRVFMDWRNGNSPSWKKHLPGLALEPVQVHRCGRGNGAVDLALAISAMDVLHHREADGFCVVSGDGDFTPLGLRVRSAQLPFYGFGPRNASLVFQEACDRFYVLDDEPRIDRPAAPPFRLEDDVVELLDKTIAALADAEGWAPVDVLGHRLARTVASYDPAKWGGKSLSRVLQASGRFQLVNVEHGSGRLKVRSTGGNSKPPAD